MPLTVAGFGDSLTLGVGSMKYDVDKFLYGQPVSKLIEFDPDNTPWKSQVALLDAWFKNANIGFASQKSWAPIALAILVYKYGGDPLAGMYVAIVANGEGNTKPPETVGKWYAQLAKGATMVSNKVAIAGKAANILKGLIATSKAKVNGIAAKVDPFDVSVFPVAAAVASVQAKYLTKSAMQGVWNATPAAAPKTITTTGGVRPSDDIGTISVISPAEIGAASITNSTTEIYIPSGGGPGAGFKPPSGNYYTPSATVPAGKSAVKALLAVGGAAAGIKLLTMLL